MRKGPLEILLRRVLTKDRFWVRDMRESVMRRYHHDQHPLQIMRFHYIHQERFCPREAALSLQSVRMQLHGHALTG